MKKSRSNFHQLMNIFAGLAQATRCCRQDTAFCGGVTFHQYMILDAVAQSGNLRISDLHGLLAVEKSTTTRLLKPLLDKKLLIKKPSADDSRAYSVLLTRAGAVTYGEVQNCLADFFHKITENLPADEQEKILQSVQTFIGAIKNASNVCTCCQ